MKKLLITNLVYGDLYSDIFLNQHLKSLLDESNIPSYLHRVEYVIFTDEASHKKIVVHPNFKKLQDLIPVDFVTMLPTDFNGRYGGLIAMLKESIAIGLKGDYIVSAIVADLVVAQDYLKKVFTRIDEGHDAVFVLPLRSAAESMIPELNKRDRALPAMELGYLGYDNLHPLWVACHYDAPQFTKLPFTLLWNSGTGLLARTFSITPVAFVPTEAMLEVNGCVDVDLPRFFTNPYWAEDWTECPILGVEPLFCYYPTFANHKANAALIGKEWTKCLHPSQVPFLQKKLYYPCKEAVMIKKDEEYFSDMAVKTITMHFEGGTKDGSGVRP